MLKYGYILFLILIFSCIKEDIAPSFEYPELMQIPAGFPAMAAPEENTFTIERWQLGKKIFFDPILSADNSISCASCHQPSLAFSDEFEVSLGVEKREGERNSPSLANVGYHPYFTREGGVPTLEMQVLIPIQEHNEFDFNILLVAERLNELTEYVAMAQAAYDRDPDAFVITRALACFERSLISGNSAYDRFAFQNNQDALSEAAIAGMALFNSERTNCSQCHSGFNFTNYAFENNGLYEEYADIGRYRLTKLEEDLARFKVPSLRNISLTAPYMHDGSMESLSEVLAHYQEGGKSHPNKSELIKPLNLTALEVSQLLSFLQSLTDESFISNPIFSE